MNSAAGGRSGPGGGGGGREEGASAGDSSRDEINSGSAPNQLTTQHHTWAQQGGAMPAGCSLPWGVVGRGGGWRDAGLGPGELALHCRSIPMQTWNLGDRAIAPQNATRPAPQWYPAPLCEPRRAAPGSGVAAGVGTLPPRTPS